MTAGRLAGVRAPAPSAGVVRAAVVLVGLASVVWLRWLAIVDGRFDGISIGLVFGVGLLAVGLGGRRLAGVSAHEPATQRAVATDVLTGLAGGVALVGLAVLARLAAPAIPAPPSSRMPAALFGPWLGATVVVALAEELILRGVLFTMLERLARWPVALLVTSAAFALMHVPVYGWHVVPLDLGVGLFLGGLRLGTGRWLAPGVAHVVADVATWWL